MGIITQLIQNPAPPHNGLLLNNLSTSDGNTLRETIVLTIEGDISIAPTCECGVTKATPLTPLTNCPYCNTEPNKNKIQSALALRTPIGIVSLISVSFYNMMRVAFTKGKPNSPNSTNVLLWVTDPTYRMKKEDGKRIASILTANGVRRGYNNFIYNMEEYLHKIASLPDFADNKKPKELLELYKNQKNGVLVDYVGFLSNITRIMEKSGTNRRAGGGFINVVDVLYSVANIDSELYEDRREGIIARFYDKYSRYWDKYLSDNIQGKEGQIRSTLLRTRGTTATRLVISSISAPHDYETIQLPWIACLYILETPITSVLLKKGMTLLQIESFIRHCSYNYNKTMHAILTKLFDEGKDVMSSILIRYPFLTRGNGLGTRPTFKTDLSDTACSISEIAIRTLNA